jgi:hypothetical protein
VITYIKNAMNTKGAFNTKAWHWACNMQMDLLYAEKQERNNYIVRGNLEDINGQRVSTGRCALASAVKPGHG